jgi:hypothetical protein
VTYPDFRVITGPMGKGPRPRGKSRPASEGVRVIQVTGAETPEAVHAQIAAARLAAERLAAARLGETPEQQLRWVVNFIKTDFGRLRPEEITALGWDLRELYPRGSMTLQPKGPMPADEVRAIQQILKEGIEKLIRQDGEVWYVPGVPLGIFRRNATTDRRAKLAFQHEALEEKASIVAGVVDLIRRAGDRLHACDICGQPLVVNKRRTHCSERCAQKARNDRRVPRASKRRRGRRAAADR